MSSTSNTTSELGASRRCRRSRAIRALVGESRIVTIFRDGTTNSRRTSRVCCTACATSVASCGVTASGMGTLIMTTGSSSLRLAGVSAAMSANLAVNGMTKATAISFKAITASSKSTSSRWNLVGVVPRKPSSKMTSMPYSRKTRSYASCSVPSMRNEEILCSISSSVGPSASRRESSSSRKSSGLRFSLPSALGASAVSPAVRMAMAWAVAARRRSAARRYLRLSGAAARACKYCA